MHAILGKIEWMTVGVRCLFDLALFHEKAASGFGAFCDECVEPIRCKLMRVEVPETFQR